MAFASQKPHFASPITLTRPILGWMVGLVLLTACGGPKVDGPAAVSSITPERDLCSVSMTITNPVTLTGTAQFQARTVSASGLGNAGPLTGIPFAEVEILNDAGTVVQCGATNASGAFVATDLTSPLIINNTSGRYTLRVNSRAFNSKIKLSVVSNPTENALYSVSGTFTTLGIESTKAVSVTSAPIDGTLEGGAFNILYQIYLANEFLRNNSSCLPSESGSCTPFTVAPKIKVFWAPGVDPGTAYLGLSYPISAYLRTSDANYKGLYILGGKQGDVNCSDTDHFDNSIILHEYGHFLEEFFAKSDSPGGSHSGNGVIDPRLAWSEGWSNFFQAAVTGNPVYQDSIRNNSCASGTALQINLKMDDQSVGLSACPSGSANATIRYSMDVPNTTNDGAYREVSVSRDLYQLVAASSASGAAKDTGFGFNYIWRAFSSTTNGIAKSSDHFRNSGLVNSYISSLLTANSITPTNFNNVMSYEKQPSSLSSYFYGQTITAKSCAAFPFSMTGGTYNRKHQTGTVSSPAITDVVNCNNTVTYSPSLQKNNQFLRYDWGGGPFSLTLKYNSAGSPNLNLYLYNESHTLYDTSTMPAYSAVARASEPLVGGYHSETISVANLAAGTYLIQVEMDDQASYNGVSATFELTLGSGATLCP